MSGKGRIGRGWALAKQSWAVLRADRALAAFPVIAALAVVAAAVLIGVPGVVLAATDTSVVAAAALWAVLLYVFAYIGVYCNVALAGAAARALDGEEASVGAGFAVARSRRGVIARWAALQMVVGIVLQAIEAALEKTPLGPLLSAVVSGLLGAAWAIATFFAVPVLALDGVGPKEALTRSARTVKERWGEGVVGTASITLIVAFLGLLPAAGLIALGVVAVDGSEALGAALIAVGVLALALASLLGATLNAIFRVALYRYATAGEVAAGFDRDALEHAFGRRGRAGALR